MPGVQEHPADINPRSDGMPRIMCLGLKGHCLTWAAAWATPPDRLLASLLPQAFPFPLSPPARPSSHPTSPPGPGRAL